MNDISASDLGRAMAYLSEARQILFQQLHDENGRSVDLVEGVDKLASAFELAEDPELVMRICPSCESLATERRRDGTSHCYSCDSVWTPTAPSGP